MSIKPIDHQISTLNTVHEAKNQQEQLNRGQTINALMQDQVQTEIERNKSRVVHSDDAKGTLVDPDQQKKKDQESKKQSKENKGDDKLPQAKEDNKGIRLDIRI